MAGRNAPVSEPQKPPEHVDAQMDKDAKAFAGGCLAGMGAVGLVVTVVVLVLIAIVVIGLFLIFLSCSGAF